MRANMDGSGSVETLVNYSGASEFYGVEVDAVNGKVYFTDRGTNIVHRVNADGSGSVETLVSSGLSDPFGIALDNTNSKIYWVDYGNGKIEKSDLNGANQEDVFAPEMTSPFGIAIDNIEGKIYWADRSTDKIYRSNLDGTAEEAIISSGLNDPFGVAVDETNRAIYWADYSANSISKANLDGSNVSPIISSGLSQPYGLALDVANNKIYWTESIGGEVNYADLDGSNQTNIHTDVAGEFKDVALDLTNNKVYWTESGTNQNIWKSDLDGSNKSAIISSGLNFPFGITVDEENSKIYWTDLIEKKIKKANLDGSDVADHITSGIGEAFGLALVSCDFVASLSSTTEIAGTPTPFTLSTMGLSGSATYSWDFDNDGMEDANIAGNTAYTYPAAGNYTASLTITNTMGCKKTIQVDVTVDADPFENIDFDDLLKTVTDDRQSGDQFGYSVAISGDYAIVGANYQDYDDDGTNNLTYDAGAAYIFKKNQGGAENWGLVKKLVASDRKTSDFFGTSVSISANYAVVGARLQDYDVDGVSGYMINAGAAYIFKKDQGGGEN
jgi:DNA-binding beta-propeller fold protein YncE